MDHREPKTSDIVIDAGDATGNSLLDRIQEILASGVVAPPADGGAPPVMRIRGIAGADCVLMGLDAPCALSIEDPLGNYALAFNRQANVRIESSVGDGVGEGMISGAIRIRGDAAVGAGTSMSGGTLAIYGRAGAYCGAAMRGGEIFVRGDVGPAAASGALWGTLVIGGDAGEGLGDSMRGATVFLRGRAAALGRGVRETTLRERERVRLGLLLINAGIRGDVKDFRRIVSEVTVRNESSRPRGEVDPNWR